MYTKSLVLRIEISMQLILHPVTSNFHKYVIIPNACKHMRVKIIHIKEISKIQMHVDFRSRCIWFKIDNSYVYAAIVCSRSLGSWVGLNKAI